MLSAFCEPVSAACSGLIAVYACCFADEHLKEGPGITVRGAVHQTPVVEVQRSLSPAAVGRTCPVVAKPPETLTATDGKTLTGGLAMLSDMMAAVTDNMAAVPGGLGTMVMATALMVMAGGEITEGTTSVGAAPGIRSAIGCVANVLFQRMH